MAQTDKQRIGQIGEDCAVKYLENRGYKILERNYRKKYGEIDIIALKDSILHFVEVKSKSGNVSPVSEVEPLRARGSTSKAFAEKHRVSMIPTLGVEEPDDDNFDDDTASVEDYGESQYEAEENVHPWKLKRLRRTIEAYLLSKYPDDEDEEPDWQLDIATVEVDIEKRMSRVRLLEDVDIC